MAPRRGFQFQAGRSRGTRRVTDWSLGPGGSLLAGISTSSVAILGSGVTPVDDGFTLVRLRGNVQGYLRSSDAVNGGFHCAIGIGIVTNKAFAIGATAVPGPITEMEWDGWLYHRFFDLHQSTTTFDPTEVNSQISFEVDSKAMRKLDGEEIIVAVVETVEVVAATMSLYFDSRMLVKPY